MHVGATSANLPPGDHAPADVSPSEVPPLLPGQPPLAILVDYDNTISQVDVSEQVMYGLIGDQFRVADARYLAGEIGSRTFFSNLVALLGGNPGPVIAIAEAQPHDRTFPGFVVAALRLGVPVEIVSDGLGFFIQPALRKLGVPPVPVITNRTTFDGRKARIEYPNGHPDCFVCGTCKRQRVLAHKAAGRTVVFIGDGESDRYAAAYSDLIFAKEELEALCVAEGWSYETWSDFAELTRWLQATVAAWRADPASLPAQQPRPFICGPEIWGPGLTDPPSRRNV
jgi:2-hydroxy-3-keto-5-methylthiopentenyl-1-phosphate phosphatase